MKAARSYARALCQLVGDDAAAEKLWTQALMVLTTALQSPHPAWRQLLSAPGYTRASRADALVQLLGDALPPPAIPLVRLLAQHRRLVQVADIQAAFCAEMDSRHRRRRVQVSTARTLQPSEKDNLDNALTRYFSAGDSGQLTCDYDTDPSLLEGFIARCGDRCLDSSLSGRMARLHTAMSASA